MHDHEHLEEEVLELAWKLSIEAGRREVPIEEFSLGEEHPILRELQTLGLIIVANRQLTLTEKGKPVAERTIRRHRLAERLLADVIDLKDELVEDSACRFEHLLHEGLEEKICILLGHPKRCPHGQPIPPGPCCSEKSKSDFRLVATLADLKSGQKGNVAYLHSDDGAKIQKLVAMGVCPGSVLTLIQRRPSFVFQLGHSQFAVDGDIARSIFVRV
jgi:DtxR family Mn-dependent transcriptional regulator